MDINEILTGDEKFWKYVEGVDAFYNPESYTFKKNEQEHYKGIDPEHLYIEKSPKDKTPFNTNPEDSTLFSPGYIGRESFKKLVGLKYDQRIEQYKTTD